MKEVRGVFNFPQDFITGKCGEFLFAKYLEILGFVDIRYVDGDNKELRKKWDIEAWYKGKRYTFEVKTDAAAAGTKNLCIEHGRADGTLSGISVTEADYFISIIPGLSQVWIIETHKLKKLISENNFTSHKMGDKKSGEKFTRGYLIEREKYKIHWRAVNEIEV